MKRAEMRIVGLNKTTVFVQRKIKGDWSAHRGWEQAVMNDVEFDTMMSEEFPEYWKKYLEADTEKDAKSWFYDFGCTEKMKRKGESFIYR